MLGMDDLLAGVVQIGGKLIDRLWPDPVQAAAAKLELFKLQQSGELAALTAETDLAKAQLKVNEVEAASPSLFVAGWRPAVGWVCVIGFGFQFVFAPLSSWGIALYMGAAGPPFPVLDMGPMMTLLFGMLGLGGLRTLEKIQGVAAK